MSNRFVKSATRKQMADSRRNEEGLTFPIGKHFLLAKLRHRSLKYLSAYSFTEDDVSKARAAREKLNVAQFDTSTPR